MMDTTTRSADLKRLLMARRREIQDSVQHRIRDGRADRAQDGRDTLEHSEADIQEEIGFAFLEMSAETLARIDDALGQLHAGQYGSCVECEDEISGRRLRALPFAVRCQACEGQREQAQEHGRRLVRRHTNFSHVPNRVTA
jgi:DnaK suppressor protein